MPSSSLGNAPVNGQHQSRLGTCKRSQVPQAGCVSQILQADEHLSSSAVSCARLSRGLVTMTFAPACRSCLAVSLPMPLLDPVTIASFPAHPIMCVAVALTCLRGREADRTTRTRADLPDSSQQVTITRSKVWKKARVLQGEDAEPHLQDCGLAEPRRRFSALQTRTGYP